MSTKDSKPFVVLARNDLEATTVDTPPTTPDPLSTSAHALHAEIRAIYQDLVELETLVPGDKINNLLTRLVSLCIAPHDAAFTDYFFSIKGAEDLCSKLRTICAVAEGELEKYWVDRMLATTNDSSK